MIEYCVFEAQTRLLAKIGRLPGHAIFYGLGLICLIQLSEDETIENALKVLAKGGIHHILIRGAGGKTVGIVSAVGLLGGSPGTIGLFRVVSDYFVLW